MPKPIPPNPNIPPDAVIKNAPTNGFVISDDKKSASRVFSVDGTNLTITVYFPKNCTPEQRNKRLQNFSTENLEVLGAHALALGLGRDSKKGKGKISAIVFKQDNTRQLTEAVKYFAGGSTPKVLNVKYYNDKIDAITDLENPKRKKLVNQKSTFEKVQNFWRQLQNPVPASPLIPSSGHKLNVPNSESEDDFEEIENDESEESEQSEVENESSQAKPQPNPNANPNP